MAILRHLVGPRQVPQVCLCMIVKNEAHVIRRCLESVKHMVHSWAIVDTGSTDGTQDIIREVMGDKPGELIERAWVDFATNRNQSLDLAKTFNTDYFLTIDADEEAVGELRTNRCKVGLVRIDTGIGDPLPRAVLLDAKLPWEYKGRIHEMPECLEGQFDGVLLDGLVYRTDSKGSRHQVPGWAMNDLSIMVDELQKDPSNQRKVYLLGTMLINNGFIVPGSDLMIQCREFTKALKTQMGA